jgi:hypothetical protein
MVSLILNNVIVIDVYNFAASGTDRVGASWMMAAGQIQKGRAHFFTIRHALTVLAVLVYR